jgi:hypothetical protein
MSLGGFLPSVAFIPLAKVHLSELRFRTHLSKRVSAECNSKNGNRINFLRYCCRDIFDPTGPHTEFRYFSSARLAC